MSEFRMDILELVWLAGLLEGEGYFGLRHDRRSSVQRAEIQVQMTDYDVIIRVTQFFNKNKPTTSLLPSGKAIYKTSLEGKRAVEMMKLLQPYMFGRRSQRIQEVLDYYKERGDKAEKETADARTFVDALAPELLRDLHLLEAAAAAVDERK